MKVRHHPSGECPARPGPPTPLFPARLVHPAGIVLEMDPRVADEHPVGSVPHEPDHRRIGKRPIRKDGLIAREVRPQGPVEAEDGPRRISSVPERVRVFKAGAIEKCAAFAVGERIERAPV